MTQTKSETPQDFLRTSVKNARKAYAEGRTNLLALDKPGVSDTVITSKLWSLSKAVDDAELALQLYMDKLEAEGQDKPKRAPARRAPKPVQQTISEVVEASKPRPANRPAPKVV